MNALYVAVFVCLAACANAKPSGHGVVVAGPSGIVTGHGAVGPLGYGLHGAHHDGQWHGEGLWESGALHGGAWAGHGLAAHVVAPHVSAHVVGPTAHATLVGPSSHATIVGPSAHTTVVAGHAGHGIVAPALAYGHGYAGLGYAGHGYAGHGYGGHGVAVVGPHTVPAVIAGPSGKIVADGLYGADHGHHW